jgi:acyl-coenzyme A thioesterase PaaI-like protein
MRFDEATAIEQVDDGRWRAEVHEGWDILGNANGGYLLVVAARAAVLATGKPDPLTVTAHYLAPAKAGPLDAQVEVHRIGGRHATASQRVSAGGTDAIVVLVTTTDLSRAQGPQRIDSGPPELPDPVDCPRLTTALGAPSMMDHVDLRLHPDDTGPQGPGSRAGGGLPRIRGWFRLGEGQEMDTLGVLQASDAFPPTILNADIPMAWVPTVELTTEVRARPASEWLACTFSTRFIQGGYLEEDGEMWDEQGTLVAQSRQLALMPRPPA